MRPARCKRVAFGHRGSIPRSWTNGGLVQWKDVCFAHRRSGFDSQAPPPQAAMVQWPRHRVVNAEIRVQFPVAAPLPRRTSTHLGFHRQVGPMARRLFRTQAIGVRLLDLAHLQLRSSAAEHPALNRRCVGSIPTGAIHPAASTGVAPAQPHKLCNAGSNPAAATNVLSSISQGGPPPATHGLQA